MNYNNAKKLEKFLEDKMRKIYDETHDINPNLDVSFIEKVKGLKKTDVNHGWWGDGYAFSNGIGCQCFVYFKGKEKRKSVGISIDDIHSNGWYGTVGMLHRCMDEMDEIAKEFRQFKSDLEKQEKIDQIAKNSIKTWLKAILKNQPYSYYASVSDNKITLSIKLKNRIQLDIPIYYKNFQKIMPELLNTIQQFEKMANESKIKVLISNSAVGQKWITGE